MADLLDQRGARDDATRGARPLLVAGLAGVVVAAPFAVARLVWDLDLLTFLAVVVGSTCALIVACLEDRPRANRRAAAWFGAPGAVLLTAQVAYVVTGGGRTPEPSDPALAIGLLVGFAVLAVTVTLLWIALVLWLASWLVGATANHQDTAHGAAKARPGREQ